VKPNRMLSVLVLLLVTLGPTARADEAPRLEVALSDGRLSVDAAEVPLQSVLDRIGELSGARVRFGDGDASNAREPITIAFAGLPLEDGLRRLLKGKDFVLAYARSRLEEARVYSTAPAASAGAAVHAPAAPDADVARLRGEALTNPDPQARLRALEGLAANADQRAALDAVVDVLEREANPGLLERALDIVRGESSVPLGPIVKLAIGNPAPAVRTKALGCLGEQVSRDPRARQTLEAAAAADPAPGVRTAARTLLQQLATK